jgi:hypothetical protein
MNMAHEPFPSGERLRLPKWSAMNTKLPKWMVLPSVNPTLVWCLPLHQWRFLVNELSKCSEEITLRTPLPGTPIVVFSTLAINSVYKITHFQSRVGLVNKNTKDLSWFKPWVKQFIIDSKSVTRGGAECSNNSRMKGSRSCTTT